jgi:hypothetical protein
MWNALQRPNKATRISPTLGVAKLNGTGHRCCMPYFFRSSETGDKHGLDETHVQVHTFHTADFLYLTYLQK